MNLLSSIVLIITGGIAGLFSGTLGVGGGFVINPVQYVLLTDAGFDESFAIRTSFATNLLVIFLTGLISTAAHRKKDAVLFLPAALMGLSSMFTAFLGAYAATWIPGYALRILFGAVILLSALRMLLVKLGEKEQRKKHPDRTYVLCGSVAGFISGLIGIGGGIILIPLMVTILDMRMHDAVGTASCVRLFTSAGGILSYSLAGIADNPLPYSVGYVNLSFAALLAASSIPAAYLGAHIAHRIDPNHLRKAFIAIMIFFGIRMLEII